MAMAPSLVVVAVVAAAAGKRLPAEANAEGADDDSVLRRRFAEILRTVRCVGSRSRSADLAAFRRLASHAWRPVYRDEKKKKKNRLEYQIKQELMKNSKT